ncbi:MAG TPA: DUF5329 family protein [Phycisphaerae bacterium]|nr:DUF5329 family protein [Phycisphaerae bacterium]HRW52740.1 DUF5329 family protein [Phycisphaerae bacterium]
MCPVRTNLVVIAVLLILSAVACRRDASPSAAPDKTPTSATTGSNRDTPAAAGSSDPTAPSDPPRRDAQPQMTERERIEALIAALADLRGASFIRNGESHDTREAIEHMRRKWEWKTAEIQTAEDFIRLAATGSSMSGRPYTIRFADGREIASATWFRERLAEIVERDGR